MYVFESQGHSLSLMDIVQVNILIDETGHARLADFGLLAIIWNGTSHTSSSLLTQGGTVQWMSPELFYPEKFGLKDSRPTTHSDCYALGMVIYEVLSGQAPFHRHGAYVVVAKVTVGERPRQPRGVKGEWFTDGVWGVLERCWTPKPDDRPRIEDVLRCLEEVSRVWTPLSRIAADPQTTDSPMWSRSDLDTEGTTGEREAPSPSQSLQMLPPNGNADDRTSIPTLLTRL